MVKCLNCGGSLRFHPDTQELKCDFCDTVFPVEDTREEVVSKEGEGATYETKLFCCPMCGAEITQDSDTAVTFCNYCGSAVELEGRLVTLKAPSYIIPFQNTKEEAVKLYRKKIGKSLFAPSYMKKESQTEKIRGIYMPYWIYDMGTGGNIGYNGEKTYRMGDYICTDKYKLNVNVISDYKGIGFDAAANFVDELSDAIAPFDIKKAKVFYPGYMAGFYADTADVDAEVYADDATKIVGADITSRLMKRQEFRNYHVAMDDQSATWAVKTHDQQMAYMPVWFLATKHKDRVSYAVVNGQTGKVAVDIPIDYKKYLLASLLFSIPLMVILNLFVFLRPNILCICAILFAVISAVLSNIEMNKIYTRSNYMDDQGLVFRNHVSQSSKMQAQRAGKIAAVNTAKKGIKWLQGTIGGLGFAIFMIGSYLDIDLFIIAGYVGLLAWILLTVVNKTKLIQNTVVSDKITYTQPFREKIGVLIKPALAALFGVILLIVNPWVDSIYYVSVFVIMLLVIVSFIDVIRLHNKLTLREPSQFGVRGEADE